MNRRFAFALPLVVLLGCSTPPSAPAPAAFWVQQVPPPDFQRDLPLEPPREYRGDVRGHFCLLGTSCVELDPRPFEACLVSGAKLCLDKAREPLLVGESMSEEPND